MKATYASQALMFPTAPEGSVVLKHPRCLTPLSTRGVSYLTCCKQNSPTNAGDIRDVGWIPGLGRSPGGGYGNPLQYSGLENPMDRGVWQAIVIGSQRVGHDWRDLACTHAKSTATKALWQALCYPAPTLRIHMWRLHSKKRITELKGKDNL